jgi:cell wall-associated NlpC family hydrolase
VEQEHIARLIQKYQGIPYRHAGRDETGLDCLGLIHLFYKDCGLDVPDGDGREYARDWTRSDPERYLRGLLKIGRAVSGAEALKPLDLVYFRMGRNITHGGIMVDMRNFIHVLQNTRVHVAPLNFVWQKRLAGARRLTE